MIFYRGDTADDRRAKGMCPRCGRNPSTKSNLMCDGCQVRHREGERRTRQKNIDQHRALVAKQEERRLRACRELTVDGITFIVVNSYDTPSSAGRVQKSDGPWADVVRPWR